MTEYTPKTMMIVLQKYPRGGFAVAVAVDGQAASKDSADACFSSLDEVMTSIVLPDAQRYFGASSLPRGFYSGQQSQQMPPFPPMRTEHVEPEDMPKIVDDHNGHASGMLDRVRRAVAANGHAGAWLFCAFAAMSIYASRLGA